MEKVRCKICGKEFKKGGLPPHMWRVHGGGKSHRPGKGRKSWSKGQTAETDPRIAKTAQTLRERYADGDLVSPMKGRRHTPESIEKIREATKGRPPIKGAGRGISGWYKGYWCDSSWELAWVIYQLEHGVTFRRNRESFSYTWDGREHKYYPDFVLEDGTFIEIKGYNSDRAKEKVGQCPRRIQILLKRDLKEVFDYVRGKYTENWTHLYEDHPGWKCSLCGECLERKGRYCNKCREDSIRKGTEKRKERYQQTTDCRDQSIIDLYNQGETITDIGKIMGITGGGIKKILGRRGIYFSKQLSKEFFLEKKDEILQKLKEGSTSRDIARSLGIKESQLSYWRRKKGMLIEKLDPSVEEFEVRPLIEEGLSHRKIAERLGVGKGSVTRCCKKYGIKKLYN